MEKEYQKIANIFKFDEKFRTVVGVNEPFETLKGIIWEGTEKVDGTNIRIHWDGHDVEIAGHTDRAQIPDGLKTYLESTFLTKEMEYVFEQIFGETEAYIFGEGYGPKIQAGGGLYTDKPSFIVFDVNIGGFDLNRENVNDVANRLGLKSVPVVFSGTLDEAIKFVSEHHMSVVGGDGCTHEMEGVVLVPKAFQLYDKKGKMIKCKCKYRDLVKAGMAKGEN